MNLYKTSADSSDTDKSPVRWSGSLSDASKQRGAMKKEGLKNVGTETIDVPTNKTSLLEWLNQNAV